MSDFDDLYERGLVDKSGMPLWDDDIKFKKPFKSISISNKTVDDTTEIKIELTPVKYINNQESLSMRESLFKHRLAVIDLKLEHQRDNNYDEFALKVFCNNIFIGYILKYKDSSKINEFCFKNKNLNPNIKLIWKFDSLYLKREYNNSIPDLEKDYKSSKDNKAGFFIKSIVFIIFIGLSISMAPVVLGFGLAFVVLHLISKK